MNPRALTGEQSRKLVNGEGRVGYVWLKITVAPTVKTEYVELARRNGRSFTHEVRMALDRYLDQEMPAA